jgi:hypothetical protein
MNRSYTTNSVIAPSRKWTCMSAAAGSSQPSSFERAIFVLTCVMSIGMVTITVGQQSLLLGGACLRHLCFGLDLSLPRPSRAVMDDVAVCARNHQPSPRLCLRWKLMPMLQGNTTNQASSIAPLILSAQPRHSLKDPCGMSTSVFDDRVPAQKYLRTCHADSISQTR